MTKRITEEQAEAIRNILLQHFKQSADFKRSMTEREAELVGDYLQSDDYEEDFEKLALEVML